MTDAIPKFVTNVKPSYKGVLPEETVLGIYNSSLSAKVTAAKFGVPLNSVYKIKAGTSYKYYTSPSKVQKPRRVYDAQKNPFGCYNREISDGYYVDVRHYKANGTYYMQQEFIPHAMTRECQWSKAHQSDRCKGCAHKQRLSKHER
jgi:hypothetical protein